MERYLSISEMAQIHNISRQTLIYYDKIELFAPEYTDEHGYRYYSPYQIPILREICLLKSAGIRLEDIKSHITNRNLNTITSLLRYQKQSIDDEINKLLKTRKFLEQRIDKYMNIDSFKSELYKPVIETFPERKMMFVPFENEVSREELHLTMMKTWNILIKHGVLFHVGFGTMIMKESLEKENVLEGAGICFILPDVNYNIENLITVPAGEYVCMYKYGMPYDTKFLFELTRWVKENNYEIIDNIVDACLLDTTFYEKEHNVDFCQLQIPIKKMSKF